MISLLLGLHGGLGLHCATSMSVTHDEYWHLPIGLLSWKTGRFDFDRLNPPLARMWASAPLTLTDADPGIAREFSDPRIFGDEFLDGNSEQHQHYFVIGRAMVVLMSVVTGVVLAVWAWELFGCWCACVVTLLWSTSPTVLAHGSLVTTDMAATSFFILTFFSLWKFEQRPTWRRAILFGAILGCAQLTKYTALLLFPLCVMASVVLRIGLKGNRNGRTLAPAIPPLPDEKPCDSVRIENSNIGLRFATWRRWLVALVTAGVVLNAGYLFRGSFSPLGLFEFQSQEMRNMQGSLAWLSKLPLPVPEDYLLGMDKQRAVMEGAHAVYLDNGWANDGLLHYYVAAFGYKATHLFQVLLLLAAVAFVGTRQGRQRWRLQLFLLVPAVVLVAIASVTRMQIGIRYILPAFPFLMLFAGQSVQLVQQKRRAIRIIFATGVAVAAALSLRHHPHHLGYFNELAGGPEQAWLRLCDSNLDWGQDLRKLKEFLDAEQIDDVGLAYFGTFPPAEIGIRYHLPPGRGTHPDTGWHAVSVNFLAGRPHSVRLPDGSTRDIDILEYTYFRVFEPVARIGQSINVYFVTPVDIAKLYIQAED